jgi:glycerol-3-phosphate dehydrogenase
VLCSPAFGMVSTEVPGGMDREAQLKKLESQTFDILVIGGGATGAGIALDAISRGLSVACVERDDFASGTSSRSTKLIHGGVRYLERAVLDLDRGQYELVKEALHERSILLRIAPHLTRFLPLLTPLYHRTEVPYYYAGLKMYDWLAGDQEAPPSRYVSAKEALEHCPMLKADGLRGGVVYYDGQFDDARMNLSIILRATELGAVAANHVEVTGFTKRDGKISGLKLRDNLTLKTFNSRAKIVINAAGPTADALRHLDNPKLKPLLKASSGVHIVLDRQFSATEMGILIPKTEDGRLIFMLPWLGHTLVGTTDNPAKVEANPRASDEDVAYILRQLSNYVATPITDKDILARWSGLRPLVQSPDSESTAKLSREHAIEVLPSGLLTIVGGKWTTYRKMALDAVDEAIVAAKLKPKNESKTENIFLAGGAGFSLSYAEELHQTYGWDLGVCKYLNRAYGDRSKQVAQIAAQGWDAGLLEGSPYLEAEVLYGARHECARTSIDVLARRLRLSFLDRKGALTALARVSELLAQELNWDAEQRDRDLKDAKAYLSR